MNSQFQQKLLFERKKIILNHLKAWGIYIIFIDSNNPIEKFHLKFIKEILGAHYKSFNDACRAELLRLLTKK